MPGWLFFFRLIFRSILFSHIKFTGFQACDVCLLATVFSFSLLSALFLLCCCMQMVIFFSSFISFLLLIQFIPVLRIYLFLCGIRKKVHTNNECNRFFFVRCLISFALFKISVSIQCWNVNRRSERDREKKTGKNAIEPKNIFLWRWHCMFCASLFFNIGFSLHSAYSPFIAARKMLCINKSATREKESKKKTTHTFILNQE